MGEARGNLANWYTKDGVTKPMRACLTLDMLEHLIACAGNWQGTNRVIVEPGAPEGISQTAITVTPILQNQFIRIDQTWDWEGAPQEGSLLIGSSSESQTVSVHWIDTWHNGTRVMPCIGTVSEDGSINALGSWPCPPGPDWGWRIILKPQAPNQLEILMFNIHPEGQEDLGVVTELSRV